MAAVYPAGPDPGFSSFLREYALLRPFVERDVVTTLPLSEAMQQGRIDLRSLPSGPAAICLALFFFPDPFYRLAKTAAAGG